MSYTTYKEWREAQHVAFYHMCREHLIACIKHVIGLCPLPEFAKALEILEWFHANPKDDRRRKALEKIYKESFGGTSWERFGKTATVAGSIHQGLKRVLRFALDNPTAMTTSHWYYFSEAVAIAADNLQPLLSTAVEVNPDIWWENRGRRSEGQWQHEQQKKLLSPYYDQFKDTWAEYKKAQTVKEAA